MTRSEPSGRVTYAFEAHRQAIPALCPVRGRLSSVPLGYAPSLHHLRGVCPLVRQLLRYYERIRLLIRVDGGMTALPSPPHPLCGGYG